MRNVSAAAGMHLIVLGEGARMLSDEIKAQAPAVPWSQMIGMRNRLAHAYARADIDTIYEAVTLHVPAIIPELKRLLALLGPEQE